MYVGERVSKDYDRRLRTFANFLNFLLEEATKNTFLSATLISDKNVDDLLHERYKDFRRLFNISRVLRY